MSITLNTFGFKSINLESFNTYGDKNAYLPRSMRDLAVTLLKINNLVLNILGYVPGVKQISGCVRMGIGAGIMILTFALGSPFSNQGLIIGRWYDEALLTGIGQIARGALEAFVPFSSSINGTLDIIGTFINLKREIPHLPYQNHMDESEIREANALRQANPNPPYPDPNYPFPFGILHWA